MARIIRIEAEQRSRRGDYITDMRSGQTAFIHRGEDLIVELAVFAAGRMLTKSEVTTLTLKFYNSSNVLLLETIVANTDLNAAMTAAQWRNGTAAFARLNIIGTDTATFPAGFFTMEVWANEGGLGNDMFLGGLIEGVTVTNLIPSVPVSPGPATSYTKAESDALYDFAGAWMDAGMPNNDKILTRTAHNSAVKGGLQELTGAETPTAAGTVHGGDARLSVVEPSANTAFYMQPPNMAVGSTHTLFLEQGYVTNWDAIFSFPTHAITNGTGAAGFAKKSWHPVTGEGFDKFNLLYDGTSVHVSRFRQAALPVSVVDFHAEAPFHSGTAWVYDRHGRTASAFTAGSPGYAAMAGSIFKGVTYNGTTGRESFLFPTHNYAQGFTIAMVFTATASTAQNTLFCSETLGIQIVADTDGMRLQAYGGAAGTGVLIGNSYSAAPVAFVAVVRPGSAGAYVITTDATGGGQTGSFTPAVTAGTACAWGARLSVANYLACTVARTQIYRTGLNYDQARAVLDSLTEYYQLS